MIRVNFKQFQKQTQVFICSMLQFLLLIIRKWLGKKHHNIGSKLSSLEFTRLKLGYESLNPKRTVCSILTLAQEQFYHYDPQ